MGSRQLIVNLDCPTHHHSAINCCLSNICKSIVCTARPVEDFPLVADALKSLLHENRSRWNTVDIDRIWIPLFDLECLRREIRIRTREPLAERKLHVRGFDELSELNPARFAVSVLEAQ